MIRDLTKSMLSFSWGMSLFGTKQLVDLLTPERATTAFDAVTRATEEQLGDVLKGAFRAGDQLQKGMVDMTFSFLTLEAFNPSQMMKRASDTMRQTMGAPAQGPQAGPSGSQERTTGWGPASGASGQRAQGGPAGSEEKTTGWGPVPPPGPK
jgi:hypothetical protein